jgi:mannosylglycoprotein endo-beta-mannosidase
MVFAIEIRAFGKDISIYTTGNVSLPPSFCKIGFYLNLITNLSRQTISVEVINPNNNWTTHDVTIVGEIKNEDVYFEKQVRLIQRRTKRDIF